MSNIWFYFSGNFDGQGNVGVIEDWVHDIMQKRQKLEDDFLDLWMDI